MRKAVQTIVAGEPLPGSGRHVVELDVQYRSDVQALIDLVGLARQHGIRGTKLQRGRALIVTSFSDLDRVTGSDVSLGRARMDAARRSALRRAQITADTHHIRGFSVDLAARDPLLPPWAIFPLRAEECAALICDVMAFEVVISVDALVQLLEAQGLVVEVMLQSRNDDLDPLAPVFRVSSSTRQLSVFPNAIYPTLYEMLDPEVWAQGTAELTRRPTLRGDMMQRYRGDDSVWFP